MVLVYFESSQLILVVEESCVEFVEKIQKINETHRNKLQIIDLWLISCARISWFPWFLLVFSIDFYKVLVFFKIMNSKCFFSATKTSYTVSKYAGDIYSPSSIHRNHSQSSVLVANNLSESIGGSHRKAIGKGSKCFQTHRSSSNSIGKPHKHH